MASPRLTDRTEPVVVRRAPQTPTMRSRLSAPLRIFILMVLNGFLKASLWSFASNFVPPELGAVTKVPTEGSSWYSAEARLLINLGTILLNWYFGYDAFDVTCLTVLTNVPYAYLLLTYYNISTLTVAIHMNVEVLAIAIPTYLMRPASVAHKSNVPLRNRFLLNSVQVQSSNSALAIGVYMLVLYVGLKTNALNVFLVTYFDIPTLEWAYAETIVTMFVKIVVAGISAKEFLLNSSIAAQPISGTATPAEVFDPATATLDQTLKANVLPVDRRVRNLVQQTVILNTLLILTTVPKLMALAGTELIGAVGYAGLWVAANSIIATWYAWVGDTSADYEPL